ncbi:hypothetical protein JCM8208_004170 [Rhodotorula glutinis]
MADAFQIQVAQTASAWHTAALTANPRAKKQVERTSNEWVDAMQELVDQYDGWALYEQRVALGMLKEVMRRAEAWKPGEQIALPTANEVHDQIDVQLKAYDYLRWVGHEIAEAFSRPVGSTGHARRAHAAEMWFQLGVLSRISKAEFDRERPEARTGAIAELDWVRAELEEGRNPATGKRVAHTGYESLPNLSDLSHFHALNGLLNEVDARRRAAEARVVKDSLMAAAHAVGGNPGIDEESRAVDEAVGKVPWWTHKPERADVLATVRRALVDLKDTGASADVVKKRSAIVAALNDLRLSAEHSHGQGMPARSLAHRSLGRAELSTRQQAVYGRAGAGF